MTMPDVDWTTLTNGELADCETQITAEQERRSVLAYTPAQMAAANQAYLDASGAEPGEPWRQPTGAHDAYPLDWIVTHQGQTWRSLVDANVWEPGVANWAADGGEEWPAWVQPSGAPDAYPLGAKVSHDSRHWTSDLDANVWEPGVYGWTEQP